MWKGRFKEDTARVVQEFTQSLDLDWRMARHDIYGSIAHVRMLGETGILDKRECEKIEDGLLKVLSEIQSGKFKPEIELEDVHMNIENRLTQLEPLGAKLHTARSRNDQTAVTVRLYLRDRLLNLAESLINLLKAVLALAEKNKLVIVSGYTHLQQAQPISFAHYLLAWFEAFSRDYERLKFALNALNECPLGAGALAGSTLNIDREFTAKLLGFDKATCNSLDTVAQRDYMADFHYFASVFAVHASRLSEDFIIWSTQEFGWLKLPDAFCTGSSMMPQKKNPDVLELVRGKTGQVLGHMIDLLVSLKGLPMTYDRDLQEDKRGLFASLDVIDSVINILTPLILKVEVNEDIALESINGGKGRGFALATDIAEYLVERGVPFRDAHYQVGKLVAFCIENNLKFKDLSLEQWQAHLSSCDEDLLNLISPEASVANRNSYGGTGFKQVELQLGNAKERAAALESEFKELQERMRIKI
ncbi:MAG: argininosuccinate lyase [Synergistaceae bacterium]|nr:argininosuccinate lyase [Synergistaceae bacterium]